MKKNNLLNDVYDVYLDIDSDTKEIIQFKYQSSNGEIIDGLKQRKRKRKETTVKELS